MAHYVIVQDEWSGEWDGLYINGKLVDQGNEFLPEQILSAVKKDGTPVESIEVRTTHLDDDGSGYPENLDDLEFDDITPII